MKFRISPQEPLGQFQSNLEKHPMKSLALLQQEMIAKWQKDNDEIWKSSPGPLGHYHILVNLAQSIIGWGGLKILQIKDHSVLK